MTEPKKPDAPTEVEDKKSQIDGEISDKELDDVAGGARMRNTGGYGTLDYETMTSHGGD